MIGIIDSGLGGLEMVRCLEAALPAESIVYFGDTARAPYGCRSPERISAWADQGAGYLGARGARILVVASHSIACAAPASLRGGAGMPVFDVATAAMEAALNRTRSRRIGLVGSAATVASGRYERRLRELDSRVVLTAVTCPLLQALSEEGWVERRETAMIVKRCVRPIRLQQADTVILAGGYLLPLRRILQRKLGSQVALVDGFAETARRIADFVDAHPMPPAGIPAAPRVRLIVSDLTPRIRRTAQAILNRRVELESEGGMRI